MGSQQQAVDVGKLLKKDKLVLLVDLDNTVIVSRRTERPQHPRTDKDEKALAITTENEYVFHYYIVCVRPGARQFLQKMSKHFQLYVATHARQRYAEEILRFLDQRTNSSRAECMPKSFSRATAAR